MSDEEEVTALIPAFNAQGTVARAIASAVGEVDRIIVFDDGSSDDTAATVRALSLPQLTLLTTSQNSGIGHARQVLLDACETGIAIWQDADDELLPGGVKQLRQKIVAGAQWVFGAAHLVDGATGQHGGELSTPDFIQAPGGLVWEFARNYIPSIGWGMVRTSAARKVGYDVSFRQAEDYDHLLRAIVAGGKIAFCAATSHRHYHYLSSVSRNLPQQSASAERALRKVEESIVIAMIENSGLSKPEQLRVRAWYLARLQKWQSLYGMLVDSPLDHPELPFFLGVACYRLAKYGEAVGIFADTIKENATACRYNNLGVAMMAAGDMGGQVYFDRALALFPHYLDATYNRQGKDLRLTDFPLRGQAGRNRYS